MGYSGFITELTNVRKHSNADRLQVGECFGNTVIVGMEYYEGQIGVYFPVDGQLSENFCKLNDLCRRKDPETGVNCGGYLDPVKRNVRALTLRGEKSDGLFLPLVCLTSYVKISTLKKGDAITVLAGEEICTKYIPKLKDVPVDAAKMKGCNVTVRRENFAPTFAAHVDTLQLAYNLNAFKPGDVIELTLKMHGTSGRTGYLPIIKYHKNFLHKIFRKQGKAFSEYGYVNGTRRVVLNNTRTGGFYEDNSFRLKIAKEFAGKLHKGEIVYYEIVGFQSANGSPIMPSVKNSKIKDAGFSKLYGEETVFSYGCEQGASYELSAEGEHLVKTVPTNYCDVYVYRMTMANEDGDVVEYSPDQMRLRCLQMNVKCVPLFERFVIPLDEKAPGEYVLKKTEEYCDGPDPIGKTHIREGVVIRIVSSPTIAVYKYKNFSFKYLEGIIKDEASEPDMEEAQEQE